MGALQARRGFSATVWGVPGSTGFSATGWGVAGSTWGLGYSWCCRLDGSSWLQLGLLVVGVRQQACFGLSAPSRLQTRPWLQMGVWLQVGRSPWKPDEGERVCADQKKNDEGQLRVMRPQPDLRSDMCLCESNLCPCGSDLCPARSPYSVSPNQPHFS